MTARETYAMRRASIDARLGKLKAKLDAHAKWAATDPDNWGFSGELGALDATLAGLAIMNTPEMRDDD